MRPSELESLPEFQTAELRADLLSAFVRMGILSVLILTLALSLGQIGFHKGAAIDIGFYGLATATSLFLAWRRLYHPLLPYAFATFDVVLIVAHMQAIARLLGLDSELVAVPASTLIFLVLIHASMRYQPALIAYIATIFLGSILLLPIISASTLPNSPSQQIVTGTVRTHGHIGQMFVFDILPPALIATAGAILVIGAYRTRRLLMRSIIHAEQTARLTRFFSPSIAERISSGDLDDLSSGRRQFVGVLFVDIKGFTSIAESMSPEELGAMLGEFRRRVAECVFRHDGTVDKFIGDAVMVVFGAPGGKNDDARRTVECAVDIRSEVARWSQERTAGGSASIEIGIGGHYGEVFVGILGTDRLLEYTVLGDTVNVAERLERLSRELSSSVIVSNELLNHAGPCSEIHKWIQHPDQQLRGRREPISVFSIL